jgi:hypothetical protein
MGVLFDLLFSVIFGGALLVITLSANQIATETQYTQSGDMMVQEMLISTAQLVEGELRNMGFGIPENRATVISADSTNITFLSTLDRGTTKIDTISYSLGPTSELRSTKNELDRYLDRRINQGIKRHVGAVTQFKLQYYTKTGEFLTTPVPSDRLPEIHVVEVTIEVQNQDAPMREASQVRPGERTAVYSSSLWQQTRLASQNSRR